MRKSFLLFILFSSQLIFVKTVYSDSREIYDSKCAGCHGIEGDGQGPGISSAYPPPRDFRTWIFKYKSTPEDYPPTDEDLLRIVRKGIPGTAMPGFEGVLKDEEVKSVIQYIKKFSLFETEEEEIPVVKVDGIPKLEPSAIEKGKKLFKGFGCSKCHGEEGRGDGTRSQELEDDWGNKIVPRNLTKGWTYRRGSSVEDIYTTMKIGIPGTPMPSFLEVLEEMREDKGIEVGSNESEKDPWSLAYYVHSLQEEPNFGTTSRVKYVDKLPNDLEDQIWSFVKPVRFHLIGQLISPPRNFTPSVEDILVKAAHNGKEIAILVEWDDPTRTNLGSEDKIAIEFPITFEGREKPFFLLGDIDNPVNLWVFENGEFYEGYAEGVGTLRKQTNNNLLGSWIYENGRYRVLFKRLMNTDDEEDATIKPMKFLPIAIFVWDGYNGETDLKSAISTWYYFVPEVKPSNKIFVIPILVVLLTFTSEVILMKRTKTNKK